MEKLTNKTQFLVHNTLTGFAEGYVNYRIEWNGKVIYYGRVYFLKGEQQKYVYVKNIIETCRDITFETEGVKAGSTNIFLNDFKCVSIIPNNIRTITETYRIDLWELPLNERETSTDPIINFGYASLEESVSKITTCQSMLPCLPASYPVYMSSIEDEGTVYAAKVNEKFYLLGEGHRGGNGVVNSLCVAPIEGEVWTFDMVDFNQDFLKHEVWGTLIPDDKEGVHYGSAMFKIANVDCQSRYFIQWETRYGGIQCQPMKFKSEYSEDIDTKKIANTIDEQRVINKQVSSKWLLNSRYLNDEEIKTFEDLFVAPRVWLIDTLRGTRIGVIVDSNNYTEKTIKNEKKVFKLEIRVSADTQQNIVY